MQDFKKYRKFWVCLLLFITGCSEKNNTSHLEASGFSIFWKGNTDSEKWGKHLYNQLSERSTEKNAVLLQEKKEGFMPVYFELNKYMEVDYIIDCEKDYLLLKAKNEEVARWLIFQLIDVISDYNHHFTAKDVPPAILNFHDKDANFDFEYREPHFRSNTENPEYAATMGAHNVDNNWGIWGHNLHKVFQDEAPPSIYATVDERIVSEQYCFSSEDMYNLLEKYIYDNSGDAGNYTERFMIMPNDNSIVCNCKKCKMKGNTNTNATPAVASLIERLAIRFPQHQFFTSAYLSTVLPPDKLLPENMGVIVSTIELPKGIHLNKQKETVDFLHVIDGWSLYTKNIYIWDYAANFDDYLTPIPVLYGLKKQLQFYKSKGITGVFLNANGYDYASFDDVKTYVAANLMIDSQLSVDSLCIKFFDRYYPSAGTVLCNYYLSLEKRLKKLNKAYNMYGSFTEAASTYFDISEFISFYDSLESFINHAINDEKEKLKKLYTALTYTRLQIAYFQGTGQYGFATAIKKRLTINPEIHLYLKQLEKHKNWKDFTSYKETEGTINLYLNNWEKLIQSVAKENKLQGEEIEVLSPLDADYDRIGILNDGIIGFAGEYHQGWLINSATNLHLRFNSTSIQDAHKISMRFLVDKKHNILPPQQVIFYKDGILYKEINEMKNIDDDVQNVQGFITDINIKDSKNLEIKIIKNNNSKSIACDEIYMY